MNKKLAKITKAQLQIMERGILMFYIFVDYEDGCSQGVGGFCLDDWSEDKKSRIGTAFGCEMIRMLLLTMAVDDFSEMKGKHIYVIGEGDGLSFEPKGIARLRVDGGGSDLIFADVLAEFKDEK